MRYTHIMWDFNGTLLDDVQTCMDCANVLLRRRGLKTLDDRDAYRSVFTFPILDYYVKIGLCTGPEDYKTPADEWVAEYNAREKDIPLYPLARQVLCDVKARGLSQVLLSATEQNMLERQVKNAHLYELFDEIIGREDVYASGKRENGLRWMAAHPDARVLYFGDSDHDAKVADAMGVDCVLLASGHQSRAFLETFGVPVLDDLSGVSAFLDRL